MFREQLKKDLDGISPDEELLSKISAMMTEEAKRPKQPIYMNVVKWGGMAAAICLVAVGAVAFLGNGANNFETTTADRAGDAAAYVADTKAADPAMDAADAADYEFGIVADTVFEEEACAGADDFAESDDIAFSESAVSEEYYSTRFSTYDFDTDVNTVVLNENPDLSKKSIPEGYGAVEYTEPAAISDLVAEDTDIVVVKITSKYETNDYSFTGNEETDKALKEKWNTDPLTNDAAIYYVQAEAVIESEMFLDGDIIPIFVPYSDIEANLEPEKYYLLVITEYENGIFKIFNGKESVFEIMEDDTVVSQSHLKVPSMFDGLYIEDAAAVLKYEQELKKQ